MSLTTEFTADPAGFLKSKVIVVPETTDASCNTPGTYQFVLEAGDRNLVLLKPQTSKTGDSVSAYYLPWEEYKATTMDLGSDADFFFTSEMTNCRFTVLDKNPAQPKVAHVSGSIKSGNPSKARNEMEKDAGLDPTQGRRMSISGVKAHKYTGQRGDGSSAFVFGQRNKDTGWKFYAQVTKGVMSSVGTLSEDLQILNYVTI